MRTAAVVLAAGASTRLGEPKQLVRLQGETLLDRTMRAAETAGLEPIVVVLGADAKRIARECDLRRAWVVVHAGWAEGMGSSIRAGMELVEGFGEVGGVVVMTCDMPAVTTKHLQALAADPVTTTASAYAGRQGVPAYLPRSAFAQLLDLTGDAGAREMLWEVRSIELRGGEVDVDTAEDLERLHATFDVEPQDC